MFVVSKILCLVISHSRLVLNSTDAQINNGIETMAVNTEIEMFSSEI